MKRHNKKEGVQLDDSERTLVRLLIRCALRLSLSGSDALARLALEGNQEKFSPAQRTAINNVVSPLRGLIPELDLDSVCCTLLTNRMSVPNLAQ